MEKENITTVEQAAVNTLRVLSAETIANAKSGHSGVALGAAAIMYSIYKNMNVDPSDGAWFNRDRFVLSAGHGSALLYSTLSCFGFDGIDLRTFRQLGSALTGHPELDESIGVDCSTGPLGQGIAMAVGIAVAEKRLSATYNTKKGDTVHDIIDHYTYCLVGDGCLQEGISYEACNLAGLWRLNKLIVLYDSNEVQLDGERSTADTEDVIKRFEAMRWNVLTVKNGQDEKAISARIRRAKMLGDAPTLIIVNTQIGYGAKNAGTNKAHGQVLSMEECKELRDKWLLANKPFSVDTDVSAHFESLIRKKIGMAQKWKQKLYLYGASFPGKYEELTDFVERPNRSFKCKTEGKTIALRDAGGIMLNQIAKQTARLWGGSADVSSTTKAFVVGGGFFGHKKPKATDIAFGVREFAMSAIMNGAALHGYMCYCSTFLAFSDYCKAAIRMTAMMGLPVTYIFSHDGLGNAPDGPTHQATEHIAALRLIPNMMVFRPADDAETAAVYEYVFENQKPACIILSRSSVPSLNEEFKKIELFENPTAILLASGSEVSLCIEAKKLLLKSGVAVNLVSVPCLESFDASKLKKNVPVVAVEMGHGMPWWALFGKHGLRGDVISFDTFGDSGKDAAVMAKFGFTAENIAEKVMEICKK